MTTHRTLRGWSPALVGHRIGATDQTIRNWERGLTVPNADDLSSLANLFQVPPLTFWTLTRSRPRLEPGSKRK